MLGGGGRHKKRRHDPLWEARVVFGPRLVRSACRRLGGDSALDFFRLVLRMYAAVRALYAFESLVCEVKGTAMAIKEAGRGKSLPAKLARMAAHFGQEAAGLAHGILKAEPRPLKARERRLESVIAEKESAELLEVWRVEVLDQEKGA